LPAVFSGLGECGISSGDTVSTSLYFALFVQFVEWGSTRDGKKVVEGPYCR
jgi:hypothetical protein